VLRQLASLSRTGRHAAPLAGTLPQAG